MSSFSSGRCARSQAAGFSLIEVLVALLVLSLGLLGMAAMQALALQGHRDARLASSATLLARELADMMRGNARAALAPDRPYWGDFSSPLRPSSESRCLDVEAAGGCSTPQELAQAQMTDWLARVERELPGARVLICLDQTPYDSAGLPQWPCSNSGDAVAIKIAWLGHPLGPAAANPASRSTSRPMVVVTLTEGYL